MATLTIPQIAQLALNAGVQQGQNLYICTAIAMAESGGRTDAVNQNNDGTKDVGVWQINDVHSLLWAGKTDDRTDPVRNAAYMYAVSGSGLSWSPWTTFNTGAYNNYMQQVMSAVQTANLSRGTAVNLNPNNTLGGGAGVAPQMTTQQVFSLSDIPGLGSLKSTYDALTKFFGFITSPDGWIRILKVGIGMVLIMLGVVWIMRDTIEKNVEAGAKVAEVVAAA